MLWTRGQQQQQHVAVRKKYQLGEPMALRLGPPHRVIIFESGSLETALNRGKRRL